MSDETTLIGRLVNFAKEVFHFILDALRYGWQSFKANIPFFLGFMIVMGLLTIIPDYVADKIFEPKSTPLIITKIILRLIGLVLGMVSTRISLDIYDSGQPNLHRIGELFPLILTYIVGKFIYALIFLIGLFLLIVPGIIFAYMFLYVGYLMIDRNIGALEGWNPIMWIVLAFRGTFEALAESRILTDGYKWKLFFFSIAVAVVNLIGVVCLFVGLFVTIPTTLMASVYVYRKLAPAESAA